MFTEAWQWMCEWLSCVNEQVRWGIRRTLLPGEMFTARVSKWLYWNARNGHCVFALQLIHLNKKSRKHRMKGFRNIREPHESVRSEKVMHHCPSEMRHERRPKWENWKIEQWQNTPVSVRFWLTAGAAPQVGCIWSCHHFTCQHWKLKEVQRLHSFYLVVVICDI